MNCVDFVSVRLTVLFVLISKKLLVLLYGYDCMIINQHKLPETTFYFLFDRRNTFLHSLSDEEQFCYQPDIKLGTKFKVSLFTLTWILYFLILNNCNSCRDATNVV